jgi:type IV secretory pathway VirB2 component (pilin)
MQKLLHNNKLKIFTLITASFLIVNFASDAKAQAVFGFGMELCRLKACFLSNNVVMVVGSLAVFFAGIAVFMGKMTWPMGMAICIGLILITSSNEVAELFIGGLIPNFTMCGLTDGALETIGCFTFPGL